MAGILPQQQLFLEFLTMSGRLAISTADEKSILWRTLIECEQAGWLERQTVTEGYEAAEITDAGRAALAAAA
jgi:hypothetical protein